MKRSVKIIVGFGGGVIVESVGSGLYLGHSHLFHARYASEGVHRQTRNSVTMQPPDVVSRRHRKAVDFILQGYLSEIL